MRIQDRARNDSLFFDGILYQQAMQFNPKLEDTKEDLVKKLACSK
jgi:hypothetical protein